MMSRRPTVVLATPWQAGCEAALRRSMPEAIVHLWPDAPREADYAIVWKPPADFFARCRIRRAVLNMGAGVDALVGLDGLADDVPLVRLEDAGMAMQMAEYVTLAALRAYREQDAYAQSQREGRWAKRERLDKASFCIGILGYGVLGRAVADALRTFAFPVLAWSRSPHADADVPLLTGESGLHAVLAQSRMLIVLLPCTPQTRGLLDRARLSMLPRNAHLVNIARGAIVVENDLLALLDEGHLASATLDVFEEEPLPAGHPFWHHPRIVITPHVSAATLIDESIAQVAGKIAALERGEPVTGIVDRQRGY